MEGVWCVVSVLTLGCNVSLCPVPHLATDCRRKEGEAAAPGPCPQLHCFLPTAAYIWPSTQHSLLSPSPSV